MGTTATTTRTVLARNVRLNDWLIGSPSMGYLSGNVDTIEDKSPSVVAINGHSFIKDDKVRVERAIARRVPNPQGSTP